MEKCSIEKMMEDMKRAERDAAGWEKNINDKIVLDRFMEIRKEEKDLLDRIDKCNYEFDGLFGIALGMGELYEKYVEQPHDYDLKLSYKIHFYRHGEGEIYDEIKKISPLLYHAAVLFVKSDGMMEVKDCIKYAANNEINSSVPFKYMFDPALLK